MDPTTGRDLFGLDGRVAIVTGGTRGIGRAIAEGFMASGAKVVVASRKPDACAKVEAELCDDGREALAVPTHMGDVEAVNDLVIKTVERFGRLDIVVNNAATALTSSIAEITSEVWQKSFDVNLRGPVWLAKAALPYLTASP